MSHEMRNQIWRLDTDFDLIVPFQADQDKEKGNCVAIHNMKHCSIAPVSSTHQCAIHQPLFIGARLMLDKTNFYDIKYVNKEAGWSTNQYPTTVFYEGKNLKFLA